MLSMVVLDWLMSVRRLCADMDTPVNDRNRSFMEEENLIGSRFRVSSLLIERDVRLIAGSSIRYKYDAWVWFGRASCSGKIGS